MSTAGAGAADPRTGAGSAAAAAVVPRCRGRESSPLESSSRHSKRQCRVLDWRMDPEESRSDFTIEIMVIGQQQQEGEAAAAAVAAAKEAGPVTTYHVHKNSLEFGGEKGSVYFAGLFAGQTAESVNNRTRIQLDFESAAKAFPLLLDYMYGLDRGKPNLTIENAAPLAHLADYFQVKGLSEIIDTFWLENIGVDDLATCLEQNKTFHLEGRLQRIVAWRCCGYIEHIAVDSPLLNVADFKFWLDVKDGMCRRYPNLQHQERFLVLVAEFCYRQKEHLDAKTFTQLLGVHNFFSSMKLPPDTTIQILEVDKTVMPSTGEEKGDLTELQSHYLEALVLDWRRWMESTNLQDSLKNINPHLFSRAMAMAFALAREETDALGLLLDNAPIGLPTFVSVSGAGSNDANGTYYLSDPRIGVYYKSDFRFCLRSVPGGPTIAPVWQIFEGGKRGSIHVLYEVPALTNSRLSHLPRMNGWRARSDAKLPAPTLTHRFDT